LKHEVVGEPLKVPLHGLIQHFRFNAIELGQVGVEQHFLSADQQYRLLNPFGGNDGLGTFFWP
jgi:hypothetical protein